MTDSCHTCGKTSSLMDCKRCKSVPYCSADCQRRDWKTHKPLCIRKEFAGAPCDFCGTTEDVEQGVMCVNCGSLYCQGCNVQHLTRDLSGQVSSLEPCTRCQQQRNFLSFRDRLKVVKLIKESPRDPRLPHWFICLGTIFALNDDTPRGEQKAKEHFLRAAELGLGEGFTCVAQIYMKNRNWDEAKRFYRKGADLLHVTAIANLATEASLGYFKLGEIIQEDHRRPPDLEEAFRLYREAARLGDAGCCSYLGRCYQEGEGIAVNLAKAFKWSKKGAEKGDAQGMGICADCYHVGRGVEQCDEQAIYWYEKYLALEDDEGVRHNLQILLRRRNTGSS